MRQISSHAAERIEHFAVKVKKQDMIALFGKMKKALTLDGSTACIIRLPYTVKNNDREHWAPNDVICAIVRWGQVKTVMVTRSSQVNTSHLRTSRII